MLGLNVGVGVLAAKGSEKVTWTDERSGAIPEVPGAGATEVTESVILLEPWGPPGVVDAEAVRAK